MAAKKSFLLRISPELYQALDKWANDEFRSVNAHIEFLLRESLRKAGRLNPREDTIGVEVEKERSEEDDSKRA